MGIISSIYNSGYNIKGLFLGEQELKLAYLGEQIVFNEVIDDLNYVLYEFYKGKAISNTIEAPVKGAILKGNTLVNLVKTSVYSGIQSGTCVEGGYLYKVIESIVNAGASILTRFQTIYPLSPSTVYYLKLTDVAHTNAFLVREHDNGKNLITEIHDLENKIIKFTTSELGTSDLLFYQQKLQVGAKVKYSENFIISDDVDSLYNVNDYFTGMQSVKMPVLTTSNEDGTKTNILTVNEDVTLRSNGDVYDELNLLTGRLTQRIDENNEVLAQEVVKTVDLTMVDQDEQTISKLNSFNGTTRVSTEVAENSIYPTIAIEVATE